MRAPSRDDVTRSLTALTGGDALAADQLLAQVYEELRTLAASYLRQKPQGHTLQPTALVHEAYLKVRGKGASIRDRSHFAALCAVAMRTILTDHARRRGAEKRGGKARRVTLSDVSAQPEGRGRGRELDVLALDEALTDLSARSERQARVVEYRFFSGMTVDEVADLLELSRTTVEEDWRMARAWLTVRLRERQET